MPIDEKIRTAFEMWEKLAELEDILWQRYYKEFLELCAQKSDTESQKPLFEDIQF